MQPKPLLRKPQLPRPENIKPGSTWNSIWDAFTNSRNNRQALVQYMQSWGTQVYNQIIPANFIVSIVTADLSPYQILPGLGDNNPSQTGIESFIAASSNAAASTVIILPPASGSGRVIVVKKMDNLGFVITVNPSPGDTIDGAATESLAAQYNVIRLCDFAATMWAIW